MSRRKTGDYGEQVALRYLEGKGFTTLERNYSVFGGEIDIIATDPETHQIVFIEVRYRRGMSHGHPLETITKKKQLSLIRTAQIYASKKHISIDTCRFDYIALMPNDMGGHRVWHVRDMMQFFA